MVQDRQFEIGGSLRAVLNSSGGVLGLLVFANVLNFVDRHLLASFSTYMVPELGLSNTQYGLLTGILFTLFYAVSGLFMGALADVAHRPRLVAAAMAAWSALTAASALARGFVSLAIPRLFIGIGESGLTPAAISILGDRFPPERRAFATGVYYMGVPIGVGSSLVIAGVLGPELGWRNCFLLLGAVGLVSSLVMLAVRDDRQATMPATRAPSPLAGWRAVGGSRPLQWMLCTGILVHVAVSTGSFDQLWLVRERGFDRSEVAVISGLLACIGGLSGNLLGGLGGDYWYVRTGRSRATFLGWLLLLLVPLVLAFRLAPVGSALFWIGFAASYVQLGAFYGPVFATLQQLSRPSERGAVAAFALFANNVIGLGLGVTAGGMLIDLLAANGAAAPYTIVIALMSGTALLAIPCAFMAGRERSPAT